MGDVSTASLAIPAATAVGGVFLGKLWDRSSEGRKFRASERLRAYCDLLDAARVWQVAMDDLISLASEGRPTMQDFRPRLYAVGDHQRAMDFAVARVELLGPADAIATLAVVQQLQRQASVAVNSIDSLVAIYRQWTEEGSWPLMNEWASNVDAFTKACRGILGGDKL